jgi:sodium/bile acid cotransporter 7
VSTNVVFTRQAGGSEAVALINAVIGNVIGIFVSPSLLLLYLGRASSVRLGVRRQRAAGNG